MNVLEIHMLQSVPTSNINRDEDGECKTALFGGVLRQRVSSQSWKRAIRHMIQQECIEVGDPVGSRSKEYGSMILNDLLKEGIDATEPLTALNLLGKKSDALAYFAPEEINAIKDAIREGKKIDSFRDVMSEGTNRYSLDIALFGRMFASNPELKINQALYSNHAIGTHAIEEEVDYFTAVDDFNYNGAGHIGNAAMTSSTLYRYFAIDLNQLQKNLPNRKVEDAITPILKSIALAFPGGKSTTMNANTRPAYMKIEVRSGTPRQFANAFEKPIQAGPDGYLEASINAIEDYARKDVGLWGDDRKYSAVVSIEKNFDIILAEVEESISSLNLKV